MFSWGDGGANNSGGIFLTNENDKGTLALEHFLNNPA